MKIGLLWFDDNKKRTLAEKVERAAAYYEQKYNATPTVCYVNSLDEDIEDVKFKENSVELRTAPTVLPNHFWIGVEEQMCSSPSWGT